MNNQIRQIWNAIKDLQKRMAKLEERIQEDKFELDGVPPAGCDDYGSLE